MRFFSILILLALSTFCDADSRYLGVQPCQSSCRYSQGKLQSVLVRTSTRSSFNAIGELNRIRASRGLPALIEDPRLTAIAQRKANIQASRGAMFHPGGSMGMARFEGVGIGRRFTACYQHARNVRYAGAATAIGRNGQRFHALLIR